MTAPPSRLVRVRGFRPADRPAQAAGLIGFVALVFHDSLLARDVAVRRTRDGRFTLSFPVRHDRTGRQHALVRPCDAAARAAIEREVFAQIEHEITRVLARSEAS